MTVQLAALNSKDLMTEKEGLLWDKLPWLILNFSSLTTISTPRLRTKVRTRDLQNTKQARQSLTIDALSYKECISLNH